MTISDKTRKLLWGRSGNRCAICKQELIVSATGKDSEAVVGDECHIISAQFDGPRHDPDYPKEKLDSYENLILLCRVHHKMVDDQASTFTADILRQRKNNHEIMISEKLSDQKKPKPGRIRRIKKNIPDYLIRVTTGKQLVDLIVGAYAISIDHDELTTQGEVDLIGGFLQNVSDYLDLLDFAPEPLERVESAYHLTELIKDVEDNGFYVFAARELQLLEGGIEDAPSNWPVAIVHVLRNDNKSIIFKP